MLHEIGLLAIDLAELSHRFRIHEIPLLRFPKRRVLRLREQGFSSRGELFVDLRRDDRLDHRRRKPRGAQPFRERAEIALLHLRPHFGERRILIRGGRGRPGFFSGAEAIGDGTAGCCHLGTFRSVRWFAHIERDEDGVRGERSDEQEGGDFHEDGKEGRIVFRGTSRPQCDLLCSFKFLPP